MKLKDIAYALGISDSMASRLVKKGMPTHSIEAAEKWRAKNLDPSRTKQHRADGNQGGRRGAPARHPRPVGSAGNAQAAADDAAFLFDSFIQALLPSRLFKPMGIAAVMHDAGLPVDGAKALRVAAHLYLYYMRLIDPADKMGCVIPKGLEHPPSSLEFAAEARRINEFLATLGR